VGWRSPRTAEGQVSAHLIALLALVGVTHADRAAVANAIERVKHRPPDTVIVAIIEHESRGYIARCREDKGGSSRGLMQPWHADSKCDEAGDRKYAMDYDPAFNVGFAVRLLVLQKAWHRKHCGHSKHDALMHYAGKGPKAKQFAKDIQKRARELRAMKGL
jgi:hypothetical protein